MQGFPQYLQAYPSEQDHAGYWLRQLYGPEPRGWHLGVNQFEIGRYLGLSHPSFKEAPSDMAGFESGHWATKADALLSELMQTGRAFVLDGEERANTANSIGNPWGVLHSYHLHPGASAYPYEPEAFQMLNAHPFDLDFFDYRVLEVRQQFDQIQDVDTEWPYPGPVLIDRIERSAAGLRSILPRSLPGLELLPFAADTAAIDAGRQLSGAAVDRAVRVRNRGDWEGLAKSDLSAAVQDIDIALRGVEQMIGRIRADQQHPRPEGFAVPMYFRTD